MSHFAHLTSCPLNLSIKLGFSIAMLAMLGASTHCYIPVSLECTRWIQGQEGRTARIANLYGRSLMQPLGYIDRSASKAPFAAASPNREAAKLVVVAVKLGVVLTRMGEYLASINVSLARLKSIEFTSRGDSPGEEIGRLRAILAKAVTETKVTRPDAAILLMASAAVAVICVTICFLLKLFALFSNRRREAMLDRVAGGNHDARSAICANREIFRLAALVTRTVNCLRKATKKPTFSQRKYRCIFEKSLKGIFRIDESGELHEANQTMAELLGYQSATDLIRSATQESHQRPFSAMRTRVLFDAVRAQGAVVGLEMQLSRNDGKPIWVLMNARGIMAEDGRILWLEGQLTDVTRQKIATDDHEYLCDAPTAEVGQRDHIESKLGEAGEQSKQLDVRLEAAREEERKRIAMEVHDELGQILTAMKIHLSLLRSHLNSDSTAMHKAEETLGLVDKSMHITRSLVNHLRPVALNFGLVSALEWLVTDFNRHTKISCHFRAVGPEPNLTDASATAIFRIAQESLTNVARHADASEVEVILTSDQSHLELSVIDDGRGFNLTDAHARDSYGLLGMTERARLIDAQLHIDSQPGGGSTVRLRVFGSASVVK
ncbi:PAS domain S-box-containing protein [Paraburkholderia steynii]|uniref:PAS domain S-box-containing protein n=2 Tax=Paraburkholderia steynii TaxID=1245441 RepID=A0A7Z7BBK0_9BURK|nr:PAS domain S-box-containing protein [Paraburkholderia steynii]